jgi:uncharacterized protein YlxW (UPF0749 family)
VDGELVQVVEQAGPYVTAALGAYGAGVLARAEAAAVDGSANVGRRILRAVWRRRDERGRAELEAAVTDAASEPDDADAAAALRQQVKRALREDPELLRELAGLLPAAGAGTVTVTVTASGERSIAAQHVGTAITGDNATVQP